MANSFGSVASNLTGILKQYYEGPIVTQFNDEVPFWGKIAKGSEKFVGSKVIRPVKVLRNNGIGAIAEGGNLPAIGNQTVVQAQIQAKYNYGRPGFTAQLMKASQGDRGAFVSTMTYEMEEAYNDLKMDFERQLFWDGSSDLALVAAAVVSSTTITASGRSTDEQGSKWLQPNQLIDIVSASTGLVIAQAVGIVSVTTADTSTIVLNAAVTASANDVIVRSGSLNNELSGLLYSLDGATSSIYSVDRSAYPQYQGNSISGTSGQLTLNLMQQAVNQARFRGAGKIDSIFCDFTVERYYTKLLVADKRYIGPKVVGDGSFGNKDGSTNLEFNGAPVMPSFGCPGPAMFFLDSSTWKKYILGKELEWANESGSELIPQVGVDSFEMRLRLWADLFSEKPSANARLHTFISP